MHALSATELMNLEQYARSRPEFRARVLAHKKLRSVAVGPNTTWIFEDRLTVQYQVQEMLRIERIFEPAGIQDELDAYNPLIPDGSNLKATLLVEFPDPAERQLALARLVGLEDCCYLELEGQRVTAIADEDLERATAEKTSAVHFLRFEFAPGARARLEAGAVLTLGVDHPAYRHSVQLPPATASALAADLAR